VERPLLDALGAHRADPDEQAHMLGDRRLADPQLLRDQQAADAVLDQIAVDLLAEMRARRLEPFEDLQAPFAGEGAEGGRGMHLGNCLITVFSPACEAMQHIIDRALIDRAGIAATEKLIRPYIRHTPIIRIDAGDLGIAGEPLVLKLEFLQHTGSFKPRGAFASLLTQTAPAAGIVAASGGNHGVAVAYAAMRLGLRATIFVPTVASPAKLERIRLYGAELVVGGERYADALAASEEFAARTGALRVHAYDQPATLLGQGSVGLEIEADAPDIDTLLVAVGGGGL